MKIGDTIICIKNKNYYNRKQYTENKSYKITNITEHTISVTTDDYSTQSFCIDVSIMRWPKFNEYFMTLKKLRKTKLDKLKTNTIKDEK